MGTHLHCRTCRGMTNGIAQYVLEAAAQQLRITDDGEILLEQQFETDFVGERFVALVGDERRQQLIDTQ